MNDILASARKYVKGLQNEDAPTTGAGFVKIQKLKIPVFESKPRKYLQWKETFNRYTVNLSQEVKYDYLLENTKGDAHDYVENSKTFENAIALLDKEFGNKNLISTHDRRCESPTVSETWRF